MDRRPDQVLDAAAMHELIGDVQRQQAMHAAPHGVRDLARIPGDRALIDAALHEFDGMLKQPAPRRQQLRVTLWRRLGRDEDQGVLHGMLEDEIHVGIHDREHAAQFGRGGRLAGARR